MKQEFKDKRKQSILATRERRKSQACKVYEIKFDKSHLSLEKKEYLNRLFFEAKWVYNYQLSLKDIFNCSYKLKEVEILNKDKGKESREIKTLSSQMIQALVYRTKQSIINLSKSKSKGNKIGRLKFKSQINSIPLTQFNYTYKIENEKYIKLQGFKKHFKVIGLKQIQGEAEFANANLMRKTGDYYLKITCFFPKEERLKTGKVIGLDFGIKDSVTNSEGVKYNFQFPETRAIKKASRKVNKKKLGSKNRFRAKVDLQKAYDKNSNKKKDSKNKFISRLKEDYDLICIQDESIKAWHSSKMKGFGRRIQHSIMGGIISELKNYSETVIVDKFFPSTKLCSECGALNKINLDNRIYNCVCGYSCDRDTHAANNILIQGLKQISKELRNTILVEKVLDLDKTFVFDKQFSVKQEAHFFGFGQFT